MKRQLVISLFAIAAGFTAVVGLSQYLEANRVQLPESYADSDLDLQGKKLAGYAMGAEGLLADWYWMRSLQYIGGKIVARGLDSIDLEDMTSMNPRLLYPMLDTATTLDPRLMAAYSYGATILPAIDSKQAIELTEKGIKDNPEQWRLLQYLGYIHWKLKDYEKAAEAYDRGSRVPGAPPFFKLMSAKMRSDTGSRETARSIYRQAATEAPDKQTKLTAELRLQQLDSLDEMEIIDQDLKAYLNRTGHCPTSWPDLLPSLSPRVKNGKDLRINAERQLVDPSGVPYKLNREECKSEIDRSISKVPIH